jgi:hypothetical protein
MDMRSTNKKVIGAEASPEHNIRLLEEHLSEELSGIFEKFRQHGWQTDGVEILDEIYARLKKLRKMRSALAIVRSHAENGDDGCFTYLISASFLKSAHQTLTKTRDEDLVYVTGPDDGERLCALTRIVRFDLAQQSAAYAVPESTSQLRALLQLDENEERLLATLHTHTTCVPERTKPSTVDLSTQRGLEKNGYPAIGCIFSRNGYVRFYSVDRLFRVVVSGAGVKQIDDFLFRITDVSTQEPRPVQLPNPRLLLRTIDTRAKAILTRRSK